MGMSFSTNGKLGAIITIPIVLIVLVFALVVSRQQSGRLEALQRAYPSHSISIQKERVRGTGVGTTGISVGNRRRGSSRSRTKYESYWVVDGRRELVSRCTYSGPDETPTLKCPNFTLSPSTAANGSTGAAQAQPVGVRTGSSDVTIDAVTPAQAQVRGANGTTYAWVPASPAIEAQLRAVTGRTARVTWQTDQAGTTRIVAVAPGAPQ
jgi:hypothetical protein